MAKDMITLDTMIIAEEKKLAGYERRRVELDGKIKASKSKIAQYTMMKNSQQLSAMANALDGKGISFDDVIAAVVAGDLLSLQEKLESSVEEPVAEEVLAEDESLIDDEDDNPVSV